MTTDVDSGIGGKGTRCARIVPKRDKENAPFQAKRKAGDKELNQFGGFMNSATQKNVTRLAVIMI